MPLGSFLILYKIVIKKWTLTTWIFILTRQGFLDLSSRPVHLDHQAVYLHLARSKLQLPLRRHLFQLNKRQLHLLLVQEPFLYVYSATRSYGLETALASGIFLFLQARDRLQDLDGTDVFGPFLVSIHDKLFRLRVFKRNINQYRFRIKKITKSPLHICFFIAAIR